MKFLLRSLLVLAIAVLFGIVLYYAVQALPGVSFNPPAGARLRPEGERNEPDRTAPGPERRENDRGGGIRLRSLLDVARRMILFSVLVFVSILAKNLIFERRLFKKRPPN
jgi:hypothetical protein